MPWVLAEVTTVLLGMAVMVCVVAKTRAGIEVGPAVGILTLRMRVGLSHFVSYVCPRR